MTAAKAGEPAFPGFNRRDGSFDTIPQGGLTKREYFAALAMQGMQLKNMGSYSESDVNRGDHLLHPKWVAKAAVFYADALLAALEQK